MVRRRRHDARERADKGEEIELQDFGVEEEQARESFSWSQYYWARFFSWTGVEPTNDFRARVAMIVLTFVILLGILGVTFCFWLVYIVIDKWWNLHAEDITCSGVNKSVESGKETTN